MLRWLHAKLPERFRVLGSLWLISCGVHVLLLIIAISIGGFSTRQALVVSAARRNKNARIVLLPMYKTVRNTKFDSAPTSKKVAAQLAKQKVQKKPVQKVVKKLQPKVTPKKKTSTTLASKQKPKPKVVKKPAPKVAQKTTKKPIVKKTEKVAKSQPLKPKAAKQVAKSQPLIPSESRSDLYRGKENIIYVGRDDLRAMQTQNVVADALQKNWRPPSGIAQETVCQISFDVGKNGKACNVIMNEGSPVLIFDVAARTAIMQAHFSRVAHGKQFTVAFKP